MDLMTSRHAKMMQALKTLETAIRNFNIIKTKKNHELPSFTDQDEMRRTYRDSMVQRFEYCTDLFWKYLNKYLEANLINPDINAPAPTIRASFAAGILNDREAEKALEMIKDRNLTSHIYKEEIAETLATKIPQHYELMHTVIKRLKPE